ncbi:conserved Plasmodium protein, unknown function [Plasmodium vinckei vinckei]|uniref:Uncharacterized protein n=1 Tax=Plasmodium vinckei vinckei TaxID=54757 RepID=A0A449BTX0_PLAVN|nr:conserved Plasmodium protein, unknown function [Plasmodium vinckei vinckei]KEG03120.1 hypothetical protein YYE_02051 [Plasmodium vinckei vinckei]VEV56927.1 conserved Plasmodium protein, unknown function [Plasmodium vinckei vinckei]
MKDINLLIERLKISREKEFEKDLKILLEINSHNHKTSVKNDEEISSYITHIKNAHNDIKGKTIFENSYFSNILNCYRKSEQYNDSMNFKGNTNITNDKSNICNENLVNFFHMYLIRKYSEIEYYKWLYSDFSKIFLFKRTGENCRNNYLNSYKCFLYVYSKIVEYILLKNEGMNDNLTQFCKNTLLKTSEEFECLSKMNKKDIYSNLIPNNVNLIKYAYFIIELLCKDNNTNSLSILYALYSYIYLLSNFFYACSLKNYSKKLEGTSQGNINTDSTATNIGNCLYKNADNSKLTCPHFNHMVKYGESKFMELNEMMLYFISKKGLEKSDCNIENIIKNLNIFKYSTYLKKNAFSEIFMNSQNNYEEMCAKYENIMNEIFQKICNFSDITPLYLNKLVSNKEGNGKCVEGVGECLKKVNFDTTPFGKSEFNVDTDLFKNHLNNVNINDEKNNFLKHFNNNESNELNSFSGFINEFKYVAIDFDITITKEDSYYMLFRLLTSNFCKSKPSGNLDLSPEEINLYQNINIDMLNDNNKNEFSPEEKSLYLKKIGDWYHIDECKVIKELTEKEDISAPHSDSYYYFLKEIGKLHKNYSMLLSYYGIFKDINVDKLNSIIDENYELFPLNDYFLEVFLKLIKFKNENKNKFYFDVVTLNFKKQICMYTIRNNLIKYAKACEETKESLEIVKKKYYDELKKHFNIYYLKNHNYDKDTRKYKGTYEYNRLKIKHSHYNKGDTIEKACISSIFDKAVIINKVSSLLNSSNKKLTSFIGDSLIDIEAMLVVDIPILIGNNKSLLTFCEKHDILIKPLAFAAEKIEYLKRQRSENTSKTSNTQEETKSNTNQTHNKPFDNSKKILYSAESWAEIGVFFFGNIYNMK